MNLNRLVLVLSVLIFGWGGSPSLGAELTFDAGLGYDFLSQEYFFDSLAVDTLNALTELKTTYLNDYKGQLSATYLPTGKRNMRFNARLEAGRDVVRTRWQGDLRSHAGSVNVDCNAELDWRHGYRGSNEASDNYTFGRARTKAELPVSGGTSLWTDIHVDFVDFESADAYSYDHYRLGGKAGLTREFSEYSSIDFDVFLKARRVQDTTRLNYESFGAEASFLAFHGSGDFDAYTYFEVRDYNREDDLDDYTRFELDCRNLMHVGDLVLLRQELAVEGLRYRAPDIYSSHYTQLRLDLLWGLEHGGLSALAGPHFEILSQVEEEGATSSEDYSEYGLRCDLDYLGMGTLFGSLQAVFGRRNLQIEGDLLSDFAFTRINLLLDWSLPGRLNLNVLFAADREWHELAEEDNRTLLLSSSLTRSF